jgi:probable rRNA maturation factor
MTGELRLINRQRTQAVDLLQLRRVVRGLMAELPNVAEFDLVIHLVNGREMTGLNETRLRHAGSTDVITFDYSDEASEQIVGELFVCLDEALTQAPRFRTMWQAELVRYIIHGVLHLRGYDDLKPAKRRRMKREEGRLLGKLGRRFRLSKLARKPRVIR